MFKKIRAILSVLALAVALMAVPQTASAYNESGYITVGSGSAVSYVFYEGSGIRNPVSGHRLVMQCDGNLVLYTSSNRPLWQSGTAGHPEAILAAQSDGNIVIYGNGVPLWHTGTYYR